jgi:ATP-dependent protease ClpP protease subunit
MKQTGLNLRAMAGVIILEIYGEMYWWSELDEYLKWQVNQHGADAPMVVRIDSVGGDPRLGLALYNIIKNHQGKTTACIEYICDSSATLPACACDEVIGNEFPFEYMIHEPEIDQGWARVEEARQGADYLEGIRDDFVRIYVEKTGQPEAQIREWMKATKFMKSDEALALGFIDRIEAVQSTLEAKVDYKMAAKAYDRPQGYELEGRGTSPATSNNNQPTGTIMEWWKKLSAKWGLGDSADESDVVVMGHELKALADQVPALQAQVETLEQEKSDLEAKVAELEGEEPTEEELEAQAAEQVEAELTAAVTAFKITADAKQGYAETFKGNVEGLKAALELIPVNAVKPGGNVQRPNTKAKAGFGVSETVSKHFQS